MWAKERKRCSECIHSTWSKVPSLKGRQAPSPRVRSKGSTTGPVGAWTSMPKRRMPPFPPAGPGPHRSRRQCGGCAIPPPFPPAPAGAVFSGRWTGVATGGPRCGISQCAQSPVQRVAQRRESGRQEAGLYLDTQCAAHDRDNLLPKIGSLIGKRIHLACGLGPGEGQPHTRRQVVDVGHAHRVAAIADEPRTASARRQALSWRRGK